MSIGTVPRSGHPHAGAVISEDGLYRYRLWRTWNPDLLIRIKPVLFVMLNPSVADATEDDATLRRCIDFAKTWGYGGCELVNVYGLRSTDPKGLWKVADPVGPLNLDFIERTARTCDRIVCAWGTHAGAVQVLSTVQVLQRAWPDKRNHAADTSSPGRRALWHLGLTGNGQPRHPLRLSRTTERVMWNPMCESCDVPCPHTHCGSCGAYDHAAESCPE